MRNLVTKNELIESNSIAEYGRLEAERKLKMALGFIEYIYLVDDESVLGRVAGQVFRELSKKPE